MPRVSLQTRGLKLSPLFSCWNSSELPALLCNSIFSLILLWFCQALEELPLETSETAMGRPEKRGDLEDPYKRRADGTKAHHVMSTEGNSVLFNSNVITEKGSLCLYRLMQQLQMQVSVTSFLQARKQRMKDQTIGAHNVNLRGFHSWNNTSINCGPTRKSILLFFSFFLSNKLIY